MIKSLTNPFRGLRYPVEVGLLAGLAFFLPIVEAPKNILAAFYAIAWIVNRARARDWGGRLDAWDALFTLWITSGLVVAEFAGIHHHEWHGALDLIRYGTVLWLVRRSGYGAREFRIVFITLVASTVIGLIQGYWALAFDPKRVFLQLNSVGHVNHSAIYLAIMLGAAIGVGAAYWTRLSKSLRVVAVVIAAFLAASLVKMESRAALAGGLACVAALGVSWWPRSRKLASSVIAVSIATVIAILVLRPGVVEKQERDVAAGDVLSQRGEIWHTALTAWKHNPVFGVGIDNYSRIDLERLETWQRAAGEPFDAKEYLPYAHAHSLYLNTLAERGLYGVAILVAVLLAVFVSLARGYPRGGADDDTWAIWAAAAAAWFMTAAAGVFNTTLHHEHAILFSLLAGFWLTRRNAPAAV